MKAALSFRRAARAEVPEIVRLLADDPLGAKRERYELPLPAGYLAAFDAIDADPNNELVVACLDGRVAGVLQLTFIPYLTYQGSWRALRRHRQGTVRMGHRPLAQPRLPPRATDHGQEPSRRETLLRSARLRRLPRRHEAVASRLICPADAVRLTGVGKSANVSAQPDKKGRRA